MSTQKITIGVLSTLSGPFTNMGKDGLRGVQMAVAEFNGQVAGRTIALEIEGTNAMPESAEIGARTLLERRHVDFIVGPLSGNEGLAVRDYAKTRLDKVFLNGTAGAQDITLRDPAPNFFSFCTNGVQWMAGLGHYAFSVQGYKRIATLGENYSFPHSQVGGFMIEYCRLGGRIVKKLWVALGTTDYSKIITEIPSDIDAIFVALGGNDAIRFLTQYEQLSNPVPLIGGSITIDQPVLSIKGALSERLIGMTSSGPIADNNPSPKWQKFVETYQKKFPDGLASPSLTAYGYYLNTEAALLALEQIDGDVGEDQWKLKQALTQLQFDAPTGTVRLDHNRNAIANNFITQVDKLPDGKLYNKLVKIIPEVNQTLGLPEDEYLKIGSFDANNPKCT